MVTEGGEKTSPPCCQWTSTAWAKVSRKSKDGSLQQLKRALGESSGLQFLADRDRELVLQWTAKEEPSRLEPDTDGKKKSKY